LISVTDGNGGVRRFEYDEHRLTGITDAMDQETVLEYVN